MLMSHVNLYWRVIMNVGIVVLNSQKWNKCLKGLEIVTLRERKKLSWLYLRLLIVLFVSDFCTGPETAGWYMCVALHQKLKKEPLRRQCTRAGSTFCATLFLAALCSSWLLFDVQHNATMSRLYKCQCTLGLLRLLQHFCTFGSKRNSV